MVRSIRDGIARSAGRIPWAATIASSSEPEAHPLPASASAAAPTITAIIPIARLVKSMTSYSVQGRLSRPVSCRDPQSVCTGADPQGAGQVTRF